MASHARLHTPSSTHTLIVPRFGGMVDKARQKETLLVEEVASAFVRQEESTSVADCGREENASRHTMASSITDVS